MTSKHAKDTLEQLFIDVAFAVTPYLLYSGLKMGNREYVDFAVRETLELFRILKDSKTALSLQIEATLVKSLKSELLTQVIFSLSEVK